MKLPHNVELWYMLLLGVGSCGLTVPIELRSYQLFTDRGHGAVLSWPLATLALVLLGLAWCCCGWEALLWRESQRGATLGSSIASAIFCSGLLALLLGILCICL